MNSQRFLGFEQRRFTIEDKAQLQPLLERHPHALSGYTFGALFGWRDAFDYGWTLVDDETLVVSFMLAPSTERHLLQPIGPVSKELAARIASEAANLPYRLQVIGVDAPFLAKSPELVAAFDVQPDRGMANYIYKTSDLAELRGARYSKKRNLISQAEKLYSWTVEPLRPEHAAACREVLSAVEGDEDGEPSRADAVAGASSQAASATAVAPPPLLASGPMRREETMALELTLDHLGPLDQRGVLVRVEGRPAAFAVFEAQSADTAVIHFERAVRSWKGMGQIVNREAAREIAKLGFASINREEDLGDPGLRQAKGSYHPSHLADAWRLTFKKS